MTVPVPDQLEFVSDGDGITKEFSYPRRFLQRDEIVVAFRKDHADTIKAINIDYTIAGSSWPNGGAIIFHIAPPVGVKVVRYRRTSITQAVDLENKQRNDAQAVELQLDRLTMAGQDTDVLARSALRTDAPNGYRLAPPVSEKLLAWDVAGKAIISSSKTLAELDAGIAGAEAARQAAESARDRAIVAEGTATSSKNEAAASAAAANASKNAAASSAGSAASSAELSGTRAAQASASATAAHGSAATAATQAANAGSSASLSSNSAASAATSAAEANVSKTVSEQNATSAGNSASIAVFNASAASASAINAASSAELAQSVTASMSGGTSGQFLVKKTSANYDYEWANIPGGGDMLASVYDPNGKAADVFSMGNMAETTMAKVMTADERIKLSGIDLSLYQTTALKGIANGYAGLDAAGKVPIVQLPDAVLGAVRYIGVWDASTNTPSMPAASVGNKGWYYMVSVTGTTNIDGNGEWVVGDWIVSNGTRWDRVKNVDAVISVADLRGAITAAALRIALSINNVANKSEAQMVASGAIADAINTRIRRDACDVAGFVAQNPEDPYMRHTDQTLVRLQKALGFTPVRQGTGAGQIGHQTIHIGWGGSDLLLQVLETDFGSTWPIAIRGGSQSVNNMQLRTGRQQVAFNASGDGTITYSPFPTGVHAAVAVFGERLQGHTVCTEVTANGSFNLRHSYNNSPTSGTHWVSWIATGY